MHFYYNYRITGNILLTPFHWHDPSDTIGFKPEFLKGAYRDLLMQLKWMNPSILLFYFCFLISDLLRKQFNWLYDLFALLVFSSIFYPISGYHYGARYYYEGYALCVLFVVGKIFNEKRLKQGGLLKKFLVLIFFVGFLYNTSMIPRYAKISHWKLTERKELYNLASKQHLRNAVVFIDGEGAVPVTDLARNGIELNQDIIYARSLGSRNKELKPYFPGRTFYIYSTKEKNPDKRLSELNF